ncbi:LysR family transcriptional regulator [Granulosicoccus antarcticus]|uniref:HTH-type transcriptional regulator DmlR n=1 Tax=Granulosicoccus antarcticus IMCC3135 TaxID=1192854 RepID=A0A2Z2NM79_9GAMM|nr:LysR family transcriptional regulator [Granulosicoccus antarcticus]ASJ70888.1 HTH-type transcriptional regulator DmlR [Granulosicoccus antarcticus IMCC3135]
MDWNDQRAFLAVIETGSLSAAARRLDVAQATVRSRIESLEAVLDTVLFTRSVNGLVPTDRALTLIEPARAMANASAVFVRTASADSSQMAGVVRISVSEFVGVEVLPAMLKPLRRLHPKLVLEIDLSNASAAILDREADIAVRMHQPQQGSLIARKVASVKLGLYAHHAYLQIHGEPTDVTELAGHDWIGPDRASRDLALAAKMLPDVSRQRCVISTDSHPMQLAAARAGLGIAAIQCVSGDADSELRRVLPDLSIATLDTWIVTHANLRNVPKVRVVIDHLAGCFRRYGEMA